MGVIETEFFENRKKLEYLRGELIKCLERTGTLGIYARDYDNLVKKEKYLLKQLVETAGWDDEY